MKKNLVLVKIDKRYCDYLRDFDSRIPFNYGKKESRPFIGVLFSINECEYFAPLSSPKPKHLRLKSKVDFLKIDNGRLGAINFNNMLPVKENNVVKLDLKAEGLTKEEKKYAVLLQKQLYWLSRHSELLYSKSRKLYEKYINGTLEASIVSRCCNFEILEEACKKYNEKI